MQAEHDFNSLKILCAEIKHKCRVMRKISSFKYERMTFWHRVSNWLTLSSTIIFFSLSLIGSELFIRYFVNLEISNDGFDLLLKLSSLVLIISAIWQIVFDSNEERFRHYSCIQRFSTLINKIGRIESAVGCTRANATELAFLIVEEYDAISADYPFVTDRDHQRAKKMLGS